MCLLSQGHWTITETFSDPATPQQIADLVGRRQSALKRVAEFLVKIHR